MTDPPRPPRRRRARGRPLRRPLHPVPAVHAAERAPRHPLRGPHRAAGRAWRCSTTWARRTRSPAAPASPTSTSTSCSRARRTCPRGRPTGSSRRPAALRTAPPAPTAPSTGSRSRSNALEQMLFIQSERMGHLLPTLDQAKLDNQREVVRNERRENYEMKPYGLAWKALLENLWNPEFPYHWQTIGSHEDLQAASLADVREFFQRWYGPGNASLAIVGDIDPVKTRALVEKYFGGIPRADPPSREVAPPVPLAAEKRVTIPDDGPAPPPLPGLADAQGLRRRRRRARGARRRPRQRQVEPAPEAAGDGGADRPERHGRAAVAGAGRDVRRRRHAQARA